METSGEEKELTKQYYTIGEVAKMLGLAVSHVRHWEMEFDALKPKKTKKGDRLFTPKDVANLKLIHHLVKEKGYTLEGARKKLRENPDDLIDKLKMINALKEVRTFLASLKSHLDRKGSGSD